MLRPIAAFSSAEASQYPYSAGIPPASDAVGDVESMDFLAGQAVGLVQEIKPAGEIIREVAAQAEDSLAARLPTITGRNIFETRMRLKGG